MIGESIALRRRLSEVRQQNLKPPPKLTLVEWADERRYLPAESAAEPGRWKTSRVAVARGPMEAISDPRVHTVSIMCCTQLMKALAIDTPIPTPTGWTTMGDLRAGDMVLGADGKPCQVTAITPVMHEKTCYRVTFSDGANVVADAGHLWQVDDNAGRGRTTLTRVINTQEIFETYKASGRNRYAIPNTKPLQLPALNLPVDPYVMGVWLGDGHSYSANITLHESDSEILHHIQQRGYSTEVTDRTETGVLTARVFIDLPSDVCLRGHNMAALGRTKKGHCAECARQASQKSQRGHAVDPLRPEMQSLPTMLMRMGLLKGSNVTNEGNEKHIPEEYLRASFEQRVDLLRGLMDTDGSIGKDGRSSFVTTSRRLAEGMRELLSSLGIKGRYREQPIKYRGIVRIAFVFSFTSYADFPVFNLQRKRARQPSREGRRTTETERRRIVSVEPVPSVPVRCITVDSADSLYLCSRDMVPTHNTEFILNVIGFHVDQDPAPMIVMQPTVELAEAFSKDRVDKMIEVTPALQGKVADRKSRDGGNTILHKQFPGGHITMIGANAPGQLAMRPVRIVLCDEVDKYPASAGEEGDPIKLLSERAATFWNYKRVFTCSPTVEGRSRIQIEYEAGDQRVFEVDCPHCGHRHEMQWRSVRWPAGQPERAAYHCPECGAAWTETERQRAIVAAMNRPPAVIDGVHHGYGWRAQKPFKGHASFRVSKLASPWEDMGKLAAKFEEAKASQELLKTFVNTQLAETWKERGDAPEWKRLYERREDYPTNRPPMGVRALTAWADVQKDRIEVEVVGWGRNRESWSVDYRVFMGDTSDVDAPCWGELSAMLNEDWEHASGVRMRLDRLGVDSGYNTQTVYAWARKHDRARVMVTKGVDTAPVLIGVPQAKEVSAGGKRIQRGVRVWNIGTNLAKSELYGFLRLERPIDPAAPMPSGFCHFPQYGDEYFRQLTAEQSVARKNRRGYITYEWQKTRDRNEALDCRIGNRALAVAMGLDRWTEERWSERDAELGLNQPKTEPQKKAEEPQEQRKEQGIIRKPSTFWRK